MRDRYTFVEKDGVYFITATIVEWLPVFTSGPYFEIVVDSMKYCIKNMSLNVYAYVIMDNHFHLVVSAPEISETIASLKKFTAGKIIEQLEMDHKKWLLNPARGGQGFHSQPLGAFNVFILIPRCLLRGSSFSCLFIKRNTKRKVIFKSGRKVCILS